jgi:hypothetical protein
MNWNGVGHHRRRTPRRAIDVTSSDSHVHRESNDSLFEKNPRIQMHLSSQKQKRKGFTATPKRFYMPYERVFSDQNQSPGQRTWKKTGPKIRIRTAGTAVTRSLRRRGSPCRRVTRRRGPPPRARVRPCRRRRRVTRPAVASGPAPLRPPLMARRAVAFTRSSEAQEHRERRRARRRGGRGHRLLEEAGRLAGALQEPGVLRVLPAAAAARQCLRLQQRLRPLWRRRRRRSRGRLRRRGRAERGGLREVELGAAAAEPERGLVVGPRRGLGGVEGAQPHARRLVRVTDLRRPFPPRPLPHAAVPPPLPSAAAFRRGWRGDLPARAGRRRRRGRVLRRRRCRAVLCSHKP